jgi:pimeloyl-ACP methyl ester carboxylesterase
MLAALHVDWAGAVAGRVFFTAPRPKPSARVRRFVATGAPFSVRVDGVTLAGWSWGQGPAVYLMHGWGGLGGQLADFGPPLVAAGYRVVSFDAPGHGASGGRRSSLPEFARALRAVVAAVAPAHAVIAHSLGAAATAYAMAEGLAVERVVFLGPAADPATYAERFAAALGLPDAVFTAMVRGSERRLRIRWADLKATSHAAAQRAPLLVIHDADDHEVAWAEGAAISAAWPGASLHTTHGLGHRRLLRDEGVVAQAVAFVRAGARDVCSACDSAAGVRSHAGRGCPQWELERALFSPLRRSACA